MKDEQLNTIIIRNIRKRMDDLGLKHCKVAENIGMNKNMFSGLLTGRKVIQARYIPLLARELGCTCDDLFRDPGDESMKGGDQINGEQKGCA